MPKVQPKVTLLSHTPNPEKTVASAAKLCYSSAGVDDLLDGLTPENSRAFVQKLASLGHESPTEHASFTFAIEGVSRFWRRLPGTASPLTACKASAM